jgi:probable LLM family oxidoreductase
MTTKVELGLDSFGDVTLAADGTALSQPVVIRNLVEQAVLADQVGLDFIGIGEHHRADFAVTAPDVVLSAIAGRTERIHLGSAVTVLSSDDPVRVFQRYATLDAVSGGRAEVILGRGSFTESFPLFGYELSDYDKLFEEKVELFAALRAEQPVTWSGTTRSGLTNQSVFPHTASGALKTWLGVGGSPESVVRAARYGFGLLLAIIGGAPERFAPYSDLFHRAQDQLGTGGAPIGVHSPGHISDTDEQARDELWPHYRDMTIRIGRERGWPAPTRAGFEADAVQGSIYVGSPETVATKIASTIKVLGADRFDLKYSNGTLPHEQMMRSIELYGTKVAPMVRDMLA